MSEPRRLREQAGRHALVDGIPFRMPVYCRRSPALFAVFSADYDAARALLQGNEVHPLRLLKRALLVVSVIHYTDTSIGTYIEFSIAIACTHGRRPAPPLLPALLMSAFGTGQYVVDLPVSTEVSVKGGKGIWGMPKHQANLDYRVEERTVSSQYDLDGDLCVRIEIDRPNAWLPFGAGAVNYCAFRGLLMKSSIFFRGKVGFTLFRKGAARLVVGPHPRAKWLKEIGVARDPIMTAFLPEANGVLDDHFESWFLTEPAPPSAEPEGLRSVVGLGISQTWLAPPSADGRLEERRAASGGGR